MLDPIVPRQRLNNCFFGRLHSPVSEPGQHPRVPLPGQNRIQDRQPAQPRDVAEDMMKLAEIMQVRERWRQTKGKVETRGRPEHTDVGAATPGWTCLDPYAGLHGPKDTLCSAYAQCPVCPLGSVDFQSPYACAQAHNLLEAVRRAAETMAPQAWLKRMAPLQQKLLDTWLPQFSEPVRKAAQMLSLPPLPVPE